jgi:hypothetical protein
MVPSLVEKGGEGGLLLIKNPGIRWLRLVVPSKGPHLGLWVKLANGFEDRRKFSRVSTTEEAEDLSSAGSVLQWSGCKCIRSLKSGVARI